MGGCGLRGGFVAVHGGCTVRYAVACVYANVGRSLIYERA